MATSRIESTALGAFQPAAAMPTYPGDDPLMAFAIDYPGSLSRWKIFVKWLLALPHYVVLWGILIWAFLACVIVAWFAILITGRFPRSLWNFELFFMRWSGRLTTYAVTLQRDEYPPFGDAPYPVMLDLEYPERLSRWKIFVKPLLVIPNLIALAVVLGVTAIVVFVAWWTILITGQYPRGLFVFATGAYRWGHRFGAYLYLMTDRYPPFSLE